MVDETTPQAVVAPAAAGTVTTSTTSTIASAAAVAEKVVEGIAKVEGPLLSGISIFVPGASVVTVPMETILPLIIPDIERALNDISRGTYGDLWAVCQEFVNHIQAGKANSPVLSASGPVTT